MSNNKTFLCQNSSMSSSVVGTVNKSMECKGRKTISGIRNNQTLEKLKFNLLDANSSSKTSLKLININLQIKVLTSNSSSLI